MNKDDDIISTHPDSVINNGDENKSIQDKFADYFWKEYNTISPIITNLYLSSEGVAFNVSLLNQHNIKGVLCLSSYAKVKMISNRYIQNNISHLHLIVDDSNNANIAKYLDTTYYYIDKFVCNHKNILVHCQRGISRSATIIIYYIMRKSFETGAYTAFSVRGKILEYLMDYVRSKRSVILPNTGFLKLLQNEELSFIDKYIE